MATQNLFEKYGIKEVADVTFYRIEKKEETYESQRNISVASILKSSLSKRMVYPLDENGKGTTEGYEAYVFDNAQLINGYNYDCDDVINIKGTAIYYDTKDLTKTIANLKKDETIIKESMEDVLNDIIADDNGNGIINLFDSNHIVVSSLIDSDNRRNVRDKIVKWLNGDIYQIQTGGAAITTADIDFSNPTYIGESANEVNFEESYLVTWTAYLVAPKAYFGLDKNTVETWFKENGDITFDSTDDTKIKEAYLTISAPQDATGEEIRERFLIQQKALQDSTGVIWTFSQPTVSGIKNTTSESSGNFVVNVKWTENSTSHTGNVTINFTGIKKTDTVYDNLEKLIKETTIEEKQEALTSIIEASKSMSNLSVEFSDDDIPEKITSMTEIISTGVMEDIVHNKFLIPFSLTLKSSKDAETGIYKFEDTPGHQHMDSDLDVGTHEFTYAEQVCMHFAKSQNLITKAGTRYRFDNANELFGDFEFNDNYATAPYGSERAVVLGMVGKTIEELYDFEEINASIKSLKDTYTAKAYEVVYDDYAELVVEDEMGYYLPQQLGYHFDKKNNSVSFFSSGEYTNWAKAKRGADIGITSAINTWGDDSHYSINDAIDALKQEKQLIDNSVDLSGVGYERVFGGYKVRGKSISDYSAKPYDDIGRGAIYDDYFINGTRVPDVTVENGSLYSSYALENVLDTLTLADLSSIPAGQLRISSTGTIESNRAIYVHGAKNTYANRAYIYLLKNVARNRLLSDSEGIFEFNDKKGNKLFYQDKVFAGVETLALVVIGTYGLVFVVNRYGNKDTERIAWMVNDGTGFIQDKEAERLVNHGLIHTVDTTVNDETFEATCTVKSLKVRRIVKKANHYIPVLFLDTLKVSTIEQTAEEVYATGGKGNANLIGWDYGKEITLNLEDALFTPASMSAIFGSYDGNDFRKGVKEVKTLDRMEKVTAKRSFIVPAGNSKGTPTEADKTAQAVFYDPNTMEPYADGTPIAEGEIFYKFTRSVAYEGQSIGHVIELSADKFPGTYKIVGDTFVRSKETGEDERFQFVIPQAKMTSEQTITLEADGDPSVFDMNMTVLRPDDGVMVKFIQYDVVENEEENDGSTMVKGTENLNLLDDAELFRINDNEDNDIEYIGATEY